MHENKMETERNDVSKHASTLKQHKPVYGFFTMSINVRVSVATLSEIDFNSPDATAGFVASVC